MPRQKTIIRRSALRLEQDEKHPLFTFCLTGTELDALADVARISRGKAGKLLGYQRPQVKRHIRDITSYLDSDPIIFPNPIILALPGKTAFRPSRGRNSSDGLATMGEIEISLPGKGEKKTAWIVDGQQRAMALLKSRRCDDFPVPVNAFLADSLELQRDQFLRVNNSKPLPRGLITELLPEVNTHLPANMANRKIPSALCDLLNSKPDSPLYGMIRRSSTPPELLKAAVIRDTSLIKPLETSISEPSGCLFPYRNVATDETDFESIEKILFTYWRAVKETFPEAWGKPPAKSRLMHGTGMFAMSRLMDRVMSQANPQNKRLLSYAKKELALVASDCRWTKGRWQDLGGVRWNEVENTPRYKKLISGYLVQRYVEGRNDR
jgi:DGQHR domain-containing protein